MSDVKWIKITTNMFEDEKIRLIESMPDADTILVIWVKLLTLCGKCNQNGFIMLSESILYTDEMLSTIFNRPLSTVRMALNTFKTFGMLEETDHGLLVTNWEKHQNIKGLEQIREKGRIRQQRYREKQKQLPKNNASNVTVTLRNETELDKELDKESNTIPQKKNANTISEQDFNEIWQHYPRKKGKTDARKHISKLIKSYSKDRIISATKAFAKEMEGKDKQYIPYGGTFYNSRIEDYLDKTEPVKYEPIIDVHFDPDNTEEEIQEAIRKAKEGKQ